MSMEHEHPINAYVCQYCKGSFDKLENLNKHVQKIHTVCSSGKENRICPLCGTQCIKIEGYRNHLRHIHGHNEEGQVVLFKSFNDFLVWKNELEKRNYCKYVMREGPKKLSSNDKIHIYRCDSSVGSMKEKKSGVAVRDSCPAVITAIESTKTKGVKIEHWNTHVGHIIPIEEDELDAAIGSLGTTEIVLTSDQKYQYEGQSPDGNIFFITESNDSSLSETFVKEVPKKSSNLFQNTKNRVSDNISKPTSQKFSYKKDPTKKSGSFSYSLASVACMKPSAKKKIITPPPIAIPNTVMDNVSTTVTDSDVLLPVPSLSVTSSEVELATESISDAVNSDISSKTDISVISKEEETPATLASSSEIVSIADSSAISNQTFEFINDGSLSGQVVLLNSLPGQNSNQNVLLCPDQKFISIGPAINVETVPTKKGKNSKKSQKNSASSQIIVIPTASEKENVSSVQNILNISQNPVCNDSVIKSPTVINKSPTVIHKSPGPSILKRAKKAVQKAPKKGALTAVKNITFAPKNAASSVEKAISAEQKLSLGLNPSLDVTIIEAVEPTQSTSNNLIESIEIANSAPLEICNSSPDTSSANIKFVSNIQNTATPSSLIASNSAPSAVKYSVSATVQNSVSSIAQKSVPSSVSNVQSVNPILLNSFPPGQTFMSINNNLIPIGTPTTPLLPSNFSPGIVLASPVPQSPVTRPVRPRMTYSRPPSKNRMTYSRLASRPPVTSSVVTCKMPQNKQTSIGTATSVKVPPHTSAVPLLLIPSSGSQIGSSVPFSSSFVASSVNSPLSSAIKSNKTRPIISNPLISGSVCSVLPRPLISNNSIPVFTQLPPGAQLIPTPIIPSIPAPFLSNSGPQTSRSLLQNIPILTNTGQQVSKSTLSTVSLTAPLIGQPAVAPRAILSTTVSNTIKVQKVQLPFSKITTSLNTTLTSIASVSTSLSESTKVSSVVLNTEPISSAPAISIPPLASIGSHKPGSVIFESQGDMYMLEPVEENLQISNNNSNKNVPKKMNITVSNVNENTKASKSDEMRESAFEGNKADLSSLQKEKPLESQSILDSRVDGNIKSLSPRKNSDIKNSVQIKSIVQEKRHLKDDDVEILKKVKYYQMEMKYLASQAECKRLKLELAKAQMKNKETIKSNTDLCFGERSIKENADEVLLDLTSSKDNLELKQTFSAQNISENMAMDIDDASHDVNDKTTEDQSIGVQVIDRTESINQCDAYSGDSNHGSDICAESGYSNCDDNSIVDSENSNHSNTVDLSSKEDQAKDSLENQSSNHDSENMNCDIESNEGSNLKTQKETCSALTEEFQGSNEELKNINKSDLTNIDGSSGNQFQNFGDELMDINKIEENCKDATKENNSKIADKFAQESDKQMHVSNNEISIQNNLDDKEHLVECNKFCTQKAANEENLMDFIHQNNSNLESEKINPPSDNTQFQETLKELEVQYGREESSDIYTMIRTSVLRSLYEDMKTLCEENKKLYEKLQKCRHQEENCEVDKLHS